MAGFSNRIINLATDIRELNTNGLRSSSGLAVAENELTVTMQIVGYRVNFENDNCASQKAALIEFVPSDGKSMLTSVSLLTGASQLTNRSIVLLPIIINNHPAYEFRISAGSPADLATIQGGGSISPIDFRLLLTATSDFSVNLTYRTDH